MIKLIVPGTRLQPSSGAKLPMPDLLSAEARSTTGREDVFLPPDFVRVVDVFDVRSAARSPGGIPDHEIDLPPDGVVLIEMADGREEHDAVELLRR